jgi:hypothetical protein
MAISRSVLMVELLMSADRVITAAQAAAPHLGSDDWSPAVILGHLSTVDADVWIPRVELMVTGRVDGSPPAFTWWEPDADLTRDRFGSMTPDDAGAQLLASRTALLHQLRELSDEDWTSRAEHDTFGPMDVEGLLLQVLAHDEEHRASILLGQTEI